MMQRFFLMADPQGANAFNAVRLRKAIRTLPGILECNESIEEPIQCTLDAGSICPVPIDVNKEWTCISVGAYCERGLQAVLQIREAYGSKIYAFSEESSPEVLDVDLMESTKDVERALHLRD